MGITAVQGGAERVGSLPRSPPRAGSIRSTRAKRSAGVLVSGDMSATGMGTVTYNDGKRMLAFGHPFFNLGPVDMPMAKSEILMVLSSAFQPTKFGNATEVVGALQQDRFSGIMGELGAEAPSIPVHVKVRSLGAGWNAWSKRRICNFNVFVHQKWTPFLMMLTLSNSLQQMNEYADEMTYRMSGNVELDGTHEHSCLDHARAERAARAAAHGAGGMVGRQVQPPVPESGGDAEAEERGCHGGSAAGAPRGHHRKCLDAHRPKWKRAPRFP